MMSGFDTGTSSSGLSHAQQRAIVLVAQACAAFSFMGSAVIVVANFRFKQQLRTYSFQLVVWLAVCDLAVNLSFFLGRPSDGSGLCYAQGILQRFFQVALIQWTLLIAQSLLVLSSKTRTFEGDKRMPWNHLWAWSVSALLTIGPLSTKSFGETESSFCGVDSGDSWNAGSLWRAIFLVGVFVSMVMIVWAYVEVVKTLGRAQKNVFGLSLHATANRHRESYSTKNRQQDSEKTSREGQLSRWFSAMSRPANVKPADGASKSLARSEKGKRLSGGREAASESSDSLAVAAAAAALEVAETSKRRSSRSDSLWKRMLLGSIVEDIEGERRVSLDCARKQERGENNSSPASSISYTRSNSNVSVKDWLWSTSRDLGFFGENESLGESSEEEACTNVLWLNGMPSPTKRRLSSGVETGNGPVFTTTATRPKHLQTDRGADDDRTIFESRASSQRMPKVRATVEAKAAGGALAAASAEMDGSDTPWRMSSPAHGGDGSHIDPLAMLAPTMLAKSRLASGVASARGYVRRMSSIDADYGDVVFGNNVIRAGRSAPATRGRQGLNRKMSGNFLTPTAVPKGVQSVRDQPSPRNGAPEKNMDKFISRIKWYPVIYVLCWAFTLINGTYTIAVGQSNASFALILLATFTSRLQQGMLNFICYGLNDKLKQAWLQDFFYRRAVGSCCRALWCCCFGPCYRDESDDGSDDEEADATRQTNDAAQNSSGQNSLVDFDPADEMENGAAVGPVPQTGSTTPVTLPPVVHQTPPRALRKTSLVEYATPEHDTGQERSSLAPSRPARPSRKAPSLVPRHSARRSSSTRRRKKKTTDLASTNSAVAAAAAGVRRQRALVAGRVRAHGRRHGTTRKKSSTSSTNRAVEVAHAGEQVPNSSSRDRRRDRVEHASDRARQRGSNTAPSKSVDLTQALPIAISMPLKSAARKTPGRRAAGAAGTTPGRPRQRKRDAAKDVLDYLSSSSSDRNLSLARFHLGGNSSSEDTDHGRGETPKRRGARRSRQ
ncbi:unnamed protein product [Scytosiphon promiscuus]